MAQLPNKMPSVQPVAQPGQQVNQPNAAQQTPGGLFGQIGQPNQAQQPNNYSNYNGTMNPSMGAPHSNRPAPGSNENATAWITDNGRIDTGVDAFRQFGDQYYNHTMSRLTPQMEQQNQQLAQSLINRGLQPGTEAYNAEMARMDNRNNDMMSAAATQAEQLGLQAQNQYFGQEMANNQYDLGQNNQNYQHQFGYDNLANQAMIAQQNRAASQANANASARAQMLGQQLNYDLGMARLGEDGRQFDVGNITQTQGMDQNFLLGLGNVYNSLMNSSMNQFGAQNQANDAWFNQSGAMANMAPGVNFMGNPNYVSNQIQGNQNMMGAQSSDNQMLAGLLGGALGGFSDIRLKRDIELVDNVDGYDIYEWTYIHEPGRHRGVMAQDVIQKKPEAIRWLNGFMTVLYDLLPVDHEVLA